MAWGIPKKRDSLYKKIWDVAYSRGDALKTNLFNGCLEAPYFLPSIGVVSTIG